MNRILSSSLCLIAFICLVNFTLTSEVKSQTNNEDYVTNEIIVKFKKSVSDEKKANIIKKLDAISFKNSYKNRFNVITIRNGEVKKMVKHFSNSSFVEYAEPNYIKRAYLTPNDTNFNIQWHMSQINVEKAWNTSRGLNITVAVVDSGVSEGDIDGFDGRLRQGRDFVDNEAGGAFDMNGHGTHVAGTIGQATNNGKGVVGVAFEADILAVRVLNRYGIGSTDDVTDGMLWAADNGARVINLSLGGDSESRTEKEAVDEINDKGVVLVAAAGNSSGPVGFPAAFETVIAVGSVRFDETLSFFSSFGPEIDIVAPGGDTTIDQNGDGLPDGIYQETFTTRGLLKRRDKTWNILPLQGTSQACPHVAGAAALILAKNPQFTPDDVRNALTSSAKDLGLRGKDNKFGWGLLDAEAAVKIDNPVPPVDNNDDEPTFAANFTASPTFGEAPLTVEFRDDSIGNPNNWFWTLGDGTTSSVQDPMHTYNTPGLYSVSLTIADETGQGAFAEKPNFINAIAQTSTPNP